MRRLFRLSVNTISADLDWFSVRLLTLDQGIDLTGLIERLKVKREKVKGKKGKGKREKGKGKKVKGKGKKFLH